MKKILFLLLTILIFSACSKDNEEIENTNKDIAAITQILNGKFIGSLYSPTTNSTETEEITFNPYSSAKELTSILDGKITAYGTAVVTKYFNNHLLETTKKCYYSIGVEYKGAQPTVSFYPHTDEGEINGKEDKRIITVLSNSSFKIRVYGTSENNDKIFIK